MKKGMIAKIVSVAMMAALTIAPMSVMTVEAAEVTEDISGVSVDFENDIIGTQKIDSEYGALLAEAMGYSTYGGTVYVVEGDEVSMEINYEACGLTEDDIVGITIREVHVFYTTETGALGILQSTQYTEQLDILSSWGSVGASEGQYSIDDDMVVTFQLEANKIYTVRYYYYGEGDPCPYTDFFIRSGDYDYESIDLTAKFVETTKSVSSYEDFYASGKGEYDYEDVYNIFTEDGESYYDGPAYVNWLYDDGETPLDIDALDSIHTIKLASEIEDFEEEAETITISVEEFDGMVSAELFAEILEQNQECNIVIEANLKK